MKYFWGILAGFALVFAYTFFGSLDTIIEKKKEADEKTIVFQDIQSKALADNPNPEMLWLYATIIKNEKVQKALKIRESQESIERMSEQYKQQARTLNSSSAKVYDALVMFGNSYRNENGKYGLDFDNNMSAIEQKLDNLIDVLKTQCSSVYENFPNYPFYDEFAFDENNQPTYDVSHPIPLNWDKPSVMEKNPNLQRKVDIIRLRLITHCEVYIPSWEGDQLPALGINKKANAHIHAYNSVFAELSNKPKIVRLIELDIPKEKKAEFVQLRQALWTEYQQTYQQQ